MACDGKLKLSDIPVGTVVFKPPCLDGLDDYTGDGSDLSLQEWRENCSHIVIAVEGRKAIIPLYDNYNRKDNMILAEFDDAPDTYLTFHDAVASAAASDEAYAEKCLRNAAALRRMILEGSDAP